MLFRICSWILCAAIWLGIGVSAEAQIILQTVILHFPAEARPITNLTVYNTAPEVFHVASRINKVENPGLPDEKTVPTDEVLVSPRNFTIPAKGSRAVRLILKRQPGEIEGVYRVAFAPVERSGEDDIPKPQGARGMAQIKVLTGMGALVFATPINPRYELSIERDRQRIAFSNRGNAQFALLYGKACRKGREDCYDISGSRIYAGQTWELKVPGDETVIYSKKEGPDGIEQELVVPPYKE